MLFKETTKCKKLEERNEQMEGRYRELEQIAMDATENVEDLQRKMQDLIEMKLDPDSTIDELRMKLADAENRLESSEQENEALQQFLTDLASERANAMSSPTTPRVLSALFKPPPKG